jgi:hypothetical protein
MSNIEPAAIKVRLDSHEKRLDKHEGEHHNIWESLDSVRNRLPIWATLIISTLTALLGASLSIILGG